MVMMTCDNDPVDNDGNNNCDDDDDDDIGCDDED